MKSKYSQEYIGLLRLGAPVLVTQLGVITVSFADTMMVGAYGTNELAAAAFVNNLFMVAVVMLIGFASGVTPLIGALYGKRDSFEAGRVLRASIRVNAALSAVFAVIMSVLWFFIDKFGQPVELLPLIRPYYLLVLCGVVPMALFNCCQQMCNGVTDTATPMWIMITTNVLNIFGNWVLIYGKLGLPELGLLGAGISTLTARTAGCIAILWVCCLSRRYSPYREGLKCGRRLLRRARTVWSTSYPIMIQSGVECFTWSFGAIVSGWFGTVQLASYQVVNTMAQLGFMTFISFGVATSIRIANCMGTGDYDSIGRISTAGLHINLLLGTLASPIFILAGRPIISLFTDNAEVISAAVLLIPPLVLYQYGDAVQLTYANALRGTGYVKPLLWNSIVAYLFCGIPALLLLAIVFEMGNIGVYYSFSVCLIVAAILYFRSFRRAVASAKASASEGKCLTY